MKVRCIRAFGAHVPGDVVDGVPDGAAFDPEHYEAVTAPPPAPPKPAAPAAATTPAVKGM